MDDYTDDTSDDDSSSSGIMSTGSAPMAVVASLGNQYTSQEAHDLAKRQYDELTKERGQLNTSESDISGSLTQAAAEAKAELKAARERLLARKFDQSQKWLALAEGLGSPTKSGGFGETIGNVAHEIRGVNDAQGKFEDDQESGALKYDQDMSAIDRQVAQARLLNAKARRDANTRLLTETMKTLGREVRPGATSHGSMSTFGKIAADEGLAPGTPEFTHRVHELVTQDQANKSAQAGTDAVRADQDSTLSTEEQAHKFGVPVANPALDPYAGLSTNERKAARAIEQKDMEKRLAGMQQTQVDAQAGIAKMNRFMQLNRTVDSGPLTGLAPGLSANAQQMDAITSEVSRKMKQPGEGSTSDFDAKMFIKATISRTKNFAANRGIATAYKIMRKNELDRIAFLQDYAAVNKHMRGADAAWRQYLEANPIFDPTRPEAATLNPHRQDYRTFFREQDGEKKAVGPDIPDATDTADEPGRYPGDDIPAREQARGGRVHRFKTHADPIPADGTPDDSGYAEGGKVGAMQRLMFQVTHNGKPLGAPHSTRVKALNLRDRMVDKYPEEHFFVDPVYPAKQPDDEFEGYADGGGVTDADVYGVPDDTPAPADEKPEDPIARLRDALNAALQGISLGTADEVKGVVNPSGAASDRANLSEYASRHPVEKAAAFSLGLAPLASLLAPGSGGLLQAAILGGTTGGILGATSNVDDRSLGAAQTGLTSAIAAPAAALGVKYIYNKAGQLVDRVTGKPLTAAEEKLVTAANRDNIDLSKVATDLRASDRMNVPQGVQDAGGKRTRALIEKAATRGTDQSDAFMDQQRAIQDKAPSRVEDQINQGLAPSEYFSEADKLKDALYSNAKPLYDAAYKKYPGIKSQVFDQIAGTDDGKRAIKEAFRLMENDQVPIGKVGPGGIVQKPSLQFLDYVKRGFDQMISSEEKLGSTPLGHSLRSVRNRLRDELDKAAPEYATARQQYAGDLEVSDALKQGREDISKMQPEEVRRTIGNMSWAEKDAFKSGVAQHLYETLGKPTTDFNAAQRILGSDSMREKLKATFDDPNKWKIFEAAMDKESDMYTRNKAMISRVSGKQQQALGKEDSILSGVLDSGMTNAPGMGGISWVNRVYNWLRYPLSMNQTTANEVLKTVNRGDVKAFDATMQRLAASQGRMRIRAKRSGKAGAIAAVIAAGLLQPTPPGEGAQMEETP